MCGKILRKNLVDTMSMEEKDKGDLLGIMDPME